MGRWFPVRLLAVVLPVALLAAACGDDDATVGSGSTTTGGAATSTTLALPAGVELVAGGKLTVCSDAPYPPFEFQEEGTKEWTGFDMDLLRAIAANYGLDLDVVVSPFDGIWLRPKAGDCDLVGSAMSIKPERTKNAIFTDPYFDADQSLLVRAADAETLASLDDLAGKKIGVQSGTTGKDYAEAHKPAGAEIKSFDKALALFLALESGDIDAILQDFPVNLDRAGKDDKFAVSAEFPTGEQYGFAVRNEALRDAVNSQLAAVRANGTYEEIFQKYFPGAEA